MNAGIWQSDWKDVLEEDISRVSRFLESGELTVVSGGVLVRFEKAFAKSAGTNHALAFNSGTSALYAALWAVGVGAGDDVLVCDYGFHAMAAAVIALGARIIPCDMLADSFTLDPEDIARARTSRTKAILVHHPWGVPAELDRIRAAAGDLPIVADASHAHGAMFGGKPISAWADITCFSLGRHKLVSGGELGCVATDDHVLYDRMMIFGHTNRVPNDLTNHEWRGNTVGLKLRPHALALILASGQLKRLDEKSRLMRESCAAVEQALSSLDLMPQAVPAGAVRSYWRIVFRLNESDGTVDDVLQALRSAGIPVEEPHYWPTLQSQSIFIWPSHATHVLRRACPIANRIVPQTITLPTIVTLSEGTRAALAVLAKGG